MTDSERLDLPSASSAHRRRRCTGSEKLISELRERGLLKEIPPGADALSGTAVHVAWADPEAHELDPESRELSEQEERTLSELRRIETMLLADWSAGLPYYCLGREERLWLRDGIEPLLSGQFDVAYGQGKSIERVLILDAKTLYGEVESAEYNDQLRELVGLFRFNVPTAQEFRVAIICPNKAERCTVADYDQFEAELALRLMRLSLADSQDAEAPRTPGRYCHHCPAVLQCEEARQLVGATYNLAKRVEAGEFALPLGEKGSRILDNIKTAEPILKALKEAYKRELTENPDCLPGWRLRPGKVVREISDPEAAYSLALEAGIEAKDFFGATQIVLSRLQTKLGDAHSMSGRALAKRFNDIFGELISSTQYAPELERVKNSQAQAQLEN
jgi:uncharacterized protein DUF2800